MKRIWDEDAKREAPAWSLTGHMLLWNDGSPAHVQMEPFQAISGGWQAKVQVARSVRDGTKWLTLRMMLPADVRSQWEAQGTSTRARALQSLANYLRLTEWYEDDLGVLELR
jgi:hypothetical protein